MKRWKGILSLVLVSAVSLSGCFMKKESPSTQETDNGSSGVSAEAKEVKDLTEEEKTKKYDPAITLSFNKEEVVTDYPDGQDAENNDMYKMWEDVMGIKVKNKILTPPASMTEKMQLAISSNDIPDFGIVDNTMLASLVKNDMVEDMTNIYDSWATNVLKNISEQSDKILFEPTTYDGKCMAIPVVNSLGDTYPILYIRKDWMDALNLSEPKTMDDVFDMAMKFTQEDPDGNGKDDTYGLYMDKDLTGLDYIMASYGAYTNDDFWIEGKDGEFKAGCTDEKAKKPLENLQKLYKAGGIDKEFAVKEPQKALEGVAAGKIGIYVGLFFNPLGEMKDCVANIEGADWAAVKMPAEKEGEDYLPGVKPNVYGYMYAKKGIEHPEAVVVMLNHLADRYASEYAEKSYSTFGDKYNELAAKDEIRTSGPNNLMPFQMATNINWGEKFTEALDAGEKHVEGKDEDYQNVLNTDLPPEMQWAWKKVYLDAYLKIDFDHVKYSDYTGAPTETATKTASILKTQKLKDFVSIIMGEDIDYFDKFVKTYNDIGASQICKEIEETKNK
ncbi:extracellular solute-binding protein [Blautia liquoris]|uniref:Extracellular solute-binding protein n=1 Tax=Blautia liquoris TaxID=2779518 RepID=A0A7M2RFM1_9FIRM|nr:extracellular solute-binding protein [Blautia liquoris]QOV18781.1 extracellular solute-binding protein [Blautia liquoris]